MMPRVILKSSGPDSLCLEPGGQGDSSEPGECSLPGALQVTATPGSEYRTRKNYPQAKDNAVCRAVFELPWAQFPILVLFHRLVLRVSVLACITFHCGEYST